MNFNHVIWRIVMNEPKDSTSNNDLENNPWPYTALAFKGGSVRGRAYLDAVRELEKYDFNLGKIERVIGTSAGAIMAFGVALDFSINELEILQDDLDYEKILDDKYQTRDVLFGVKNNVENDNNRFFTKSTKATGVTATHPTATTRMSVALQSTFGLYEGQYFLDWAETLSQKAALEKSKDKKIVKCLTFGQLHGWVLDNEKNGTHFKDLYVVAYDVIKGVSCILSWETDKNMPIADAVRASISIPMIFKPYHCRKKIQEGMELADKTRLFIDGGTTGLMENFPLRKFDYKRYVDGTVDQAVKEKLSKQIMYNPKTLGLCLVDPEDEKLIVENSPLPEKPVNAFLPFLIQVLKAYYGGQGLTAYLQEDIKRTVFIQTAGVGILDFNLTDEKKKLLDKAGRDGAKRFVEQNCPEQLKNGEKRSSFEFKN